jgi:hypothetical protein
MMSTDVTWEWFVVLHRLFDDAEEHRLGPFASEAVADKADAALGQTIDHKQFYTRVHKRERRSRIRHLLT